MIYFYHYQICTKNDQKKFIFRKCLNIPETVTAIYSLLYWIELIEPILKNKKTKSKLQKHEEDIRENKKTIEKSLVKWLEKNSLISLKLTISDALGPVVIKQKAKHVEILDTYVTSKVWNDVSIYLMFINIYFLSSFFF